MAPVMMACPSCSNHVLSNAERCPTCGGLIRGEGGRLLKSAGAAMLGLALSGCSDSDGSKDTADTSYYPQPAYGVVDTGMRETGDTEEDTSPDVVVEPRISPLKTE